MVEVLGGGRGEHPWDHPAGRADLLDLGAGALWPLAGPRRVTDDGPSGADGKSSHLL